MIGLQLFVIICKHFRNATCNMYIRSLFADIEPTAENRGHSNYFSYESLGTEHAWDLHSRHNSFHLRNTRPFRKWTDIVSGCLGNHYKYQTRPYPHQVAIFGVLHPRYTNALKVRHFLLTICSFIYDFIQKNGSRRD